MQIWCSQLQKDELIEDKTICTVKSHFKRKGSELILWICNVETNIAHKILVDYDFIELSNKKVHSIGNCKAKVKQ